MTRVARAIVPSASMMSFFLLYLSAHTPANREISTCGIKPHRVASVVITPDCVSRVMYQIIAY